MTADRPDTGRCTVRIAASYRARTVGLTVHVQGPGGIVQRDAGHIVFAADGSVQAIDGPHPQFEGQTWCFALLP
jgi:hypothetical protein